MSPPDRASRAKFHWGTAFATGLKRYTDPETKLRMKHTNRRVRIPKGQYPRRIESKLTKKQVGGEWVLERDDNDFEGWMMEKSLNSLSTTHQERKNQLNNLEEDNMNGWLIKDENEPLEHEASDKEVESDLESTASSKPKWKKIAKADTDRASRNCPYCSK
ncbi:hypothetical protein Tco_0018716 [Tanacetum coccineum]